KDKTFEPYTTSGDITICRLQMGEHAAAAMFESLQSENTILTWVLRLVGFVLLTIGIVWCSQPLLMVADYIPFLGGIVSGGVFLVAVGLAFAVTLMTIATGWLFYRPVVGISLLALAVMGSSALFILGRNRQPQRRKRKRHRPKGGSRLDQPSGLPAPASIEVASKALATAPGRAAQASAGPGSHNQPQKAADTD